MQHKKIQKHSNMKSTNHILFSADFWCLLCFLISCRFGPPQSACVWAVQRSVAHGSSGARSRFDACRPSVRWVSTLGTLSGFCFAWFACQICLQIFTCWLWLKKHVTVYKYIYIYGKHKGGFLGIFFWATAILVWSLGRFGEMPKRI